MITATHLLRGPTAQEEDELSDIVLANSRYMDPMDLEKALEAVAKINGFNLDLAWTTAQKGNL